MIKDKDENILLEERLHLRVFDKISKERHHTCYFSDE